MTPLRRGERANANKFWLRLCRDMGILVGDRRKFKFSQRL
jgi:hypothetical protein